MMAYGRFIGELNKGIEGEIAAYESSIGQDGCLIHLKTVGHTIFIPRHLIEEHKSATISLLRVRIKEGNIDMPRLALRLRDNELVFEPYSADIAA
jgi:hypothetical protein